jgi:hypothetical protein
MDPAEVNPLYYGFVRRLIDGIRGLGDERLIIVETLDGCTWNIPVYNEDIGRPNTAYDFHSFAAGWTKKYDSTAPGILQGDVWNKAGLEKWIQDNIIDGLLNRFGRPVIMLSDEHLTDAMPTPLPSPTYGDWLQYYWDLYEILDRVGIWISTGWRAASGAYGLWYADMTPKESAEVLKYESEFLPTPTPPILPIIVGAGLGYAVGREPGAAIGALAGATLGSVSFKYRERLTRIGMLGRG